MIAAEIECFVSTSRLFDFVLNPLDYVPKGFDGSLSRYVAPQCDDYLVRHPKAAMVMQTFQIEFVLTVCTHALSICHVHWAKSGKIPYAINVVHTHWFILTLLIEWM